MRESIADTVKVDPRLRGDDEGSVPSFPRKRESIVDTVKVDPRLRGGDEGSVPSFPRKRESIVDTVKVDPRLPPSPRLRRTSRGDDEGWKQSL
jgi:hypothetical protein